MDNIEALYTRYFHEIYLYVLGLAKDAHIAEEITEQTFFRAIETNSSFRGDCHVRSWLCQIAKNEYLQHIRKNKTLVSMDVSEEEALPTKEKLVEVRLVDTLQAMELHQILHELPEPYKEVFHLRVFGELSFEQIGNIFGKNANWACVTFHRAKEKIQKELEE